MLRLTKNVALPTLRCFSSRITIDNINQKIRTADYAVRGEVVIRAIEIDNEMKKGWGYYVGEQYMTWNNEAREEEESRTLRTLPQRRLGAFRGMWSLHTTSDPTVGRHEERC